MIRFSRYVRILAIPSVLLLLFSGCSSWIGEPENPADPIPNIVFVLTDDQRADAVGFSRRPLLGIETPHIDRLAAEGARFDNMFVTTSLCSPSRASFLSGLYAHAHGVTNNFTDYPVDLPTLPRQLQRAGFQPA